MNHYKNLSLIPAISSHEKLVREYMEENMKKFSDFEIKKDKLGSIFAYKKSKNPNALTVMIAGHMDEVGLMVKSIEPNGALRVIPIGGLSGDVFISQIVYIYTKNGHKIPGVIGSIPPHLKTRNQIDIAHLLVDIGSKSKEETLNYGVAVGDMVLFDTPYIETFNGNRWIAKAIDNRFGCGLALEAIEYASQKSFDFNLVIGSTIQEEVGLRGAETSVNMFEPDLFIALDCSPVNDINEKDSDVKLGNGFLLRVFDPNNIMLANLRHYFVEVAEKNHITYQPYFSMGGTDAAKALDMHQGIPSTTIGLPARYIHSTAALADKFDLEQARRMLFALIDDLDTDKIKRLKEVSI